MAPSFPPDTWIREIDALRRVARWWYACQVGLALLLIVFANG